jgi:hypothetical protein
VLTLKQPRLSRALLTCTLEEDTSVGYEKSDSPLRGWVYPAKERVFL